jgi:dolichol-phosphate mannosyltransferase
MADQARSGRIRLSVAAPCYDEARSIKRVVCEWDAVLSALPFDSEIVICNDGSMDGTGAVLASLELLYPRLRVVSHPENRGYGAALASAIARTSGDLVCTIDSDGQFDLADVGALLVRLESDGLACVTGYRREKKDSLLKVGADRCLNLVVRSLFGLDLRDTNCALKLVRGELLRGLALEAKGFASPTEICARLAASDHQLGEVEVSHRERLRGRSAVGLLSTGLSMLGFLLRLRWQLKRGARRALVEP